jgi:hypothetical protein
MKLVDSAPLAIPQPSAPNAAAARIDRLMIVPPFMIHAGKSGEDTGQPPACTGMPESTPEPEHGPVRREKIADPLSRAPARPKSRSAGRRSGPFRPELALLAPR